MYISVYINVCISVCRRFICLTLAMLLKMSNIIDEMWELSLDNKPMNIFISFSRLYGVSATILNTGGPR